MASSSNQSGLEEVAFLDDRNNWTSESESDSYIERTQTSVVDSAEEDGSISEMSYCSMASELEAQTKAQKKLYQSTKPSGLFPAQLLGLSNYRSTHKSVCLRDGKCCCYHCTILNTNDELFRDQKDSLDAVYVNWMDSPPKLQVRCSKQSETDTDSKEWSTDFDSSESRNTSSCNLSEQFFIARSRDVHIIDFQNSLETTIMENHGIFQIAKSGVFNFCKALICVWRCMRRKVFPETYAVQIVPTSTEEQFTSLESHDENSNTLPKDHQSTQNDLNENMPNHRMTQCVPRCSLYEF